MSQGARIEPTYSELLQAAKAGLDLWIRTEYTVDNSTWFEKIDGMPHREFNKLLKEQILLELHRERLCGIIAGARGKRLSREERTKALEAAADLVNTRHGEDLPGQYEVPGHHEYYIGGMVRDIEAAVAGAMKATSEPVRTH